MNSNVQIERLKEYREMCGLTGEQIARELNYTPAYICQIFNGKRTLTEELARSFAKLFTRYLETDFVYRKVNHVDYRYLLGEIDNPSGEVSKSDFLRTEEESDRFFDNIEPAIKSLGYEDISFIGNTSGNLIQFRKNNITVLIPFQRLDALYTSLAEELDGFREIAGEAFPELYNRIFKIACEPILARELDLAKKKELSF